MVSYTTKVVCPKCNSEDCNLTMEELGNLIVALIRIRVVHCNSCGYSKVSLIVINGVICTETRLPGEEDTEIEYMYLGRERF